MTRMQIARRGLIAALACTAIAPTSASATHNGTCRDGIKDATCPARYFADHHVAPIVEDLGPYVDIVERILENTEEKVQATLCFYFGLCG